MDCTRVWTPDSICAMAWIGAGTPPENTLEALPGPGREPAGTTPAASPEAMSAGKGGREVAIYMHFADILPEPLAVFCPGGISLGFMAPLTGV